MKITTKTIVILLTTFLLGSCRTKLICSEVRSATIKPLPLCDISFQFNECYCRCFDLNKFDTVNDKTCNIYPKYVPTKTPSELYTITRRNDGFVYLKFTGGSYPLQTCEGLSGFFVDKWATELKPKIKKLSRIKYDNCK